MSEPFRYLLRVRYQECDAQHVVFNARYGDYVDLAVTEFLTAIFPGRDPFDGSFEIQLVRQVTEWKAPARYGDVLDIRTWCTRLGTTSFTLSCEIRKADVEGILSTSETVYVVIEPKDWVKRPLTEVERKALEKGAPGEIVDHADHLRRTGQR